MVTKLSSKSAVLNDTPFYGDLAPDPATTTGLTFGYTASTEVSIGTVTNYAAGTELLTDNQASILYRENGVIAHALVASEPAQSKGLYLITTAAGAITVVTDIRGALR